MALLLCPRLCDMPCDACLTTNTTTMSHISFQGCPANNSFFSALSWVTAPVPQELGLLGWPLWYPQWSGRFHKV